jgi:hypothetical protein
MARFKERNLRLDDNEKVVFGDDKNDMKYSPGINEVVITKNLGLSAYPPVEGRHFAVKRYVDEGPERLGLDTYEPLGFVDQYHHSVLDFDESTRTFTITPTGYPGGDYDIYLGGTKFTFTEPVTAQISDSEGLHFIYYEKLGTGSQTPSANIVASQTPWSFCLHAFIAIIHWDSVNKKAILFGEERHGVTMDCHTHEYLHTTVNTRYRSGLSLTIAATGTPSGFDGSSDTQAEIAISNGKLADEDIVIDIVNSATPSLQWEQVLDPIAHCPIYYRSGAPGYWRKSNADEFPLLWSGSQATSGFAYTRAAWNDPGNNYSLTEATEGYFLATWVMATNDLDEPVAIICGQREDSTLEAAENGNQFGSLSFGTFPFTEFKMLYRIIWQTSSGYGNMPKAVIRDIEDFRSVTSLPTGQPQVLVHSSLAGRDDVAQHPASSISVDQSSLTGNLSGGSINDVQDALEVFDQYIPPTGGLQITPPTSDLNWSGITSTVTVSANTVGFGAALFRDTDAFYEADASDISTMPCHVLALETGTGLKEVLMFGYIRDDSWTWTPGDDVYVDTVSGELTQTQPAVSGDIVHVIGWAYESNIIFFDRDKTTTEVL